MGAFLPTIKKAAKAAVDFLQELATVGAPKSDTIGLAERLRLVAEDVRYLQKDARNGGQGWTYVSHDNVVDAVGDALVKHGVTFAANISGHHLETTGSKDSKGNLAFRTFIFTRYVFTCVETGQTQECTWMGDGTDTLDKGLYKAITQSKKTFLLNFFLIATGDKKADADQVDPDYRGGGSRNDNRNQRGNSKPTARPGQAKSGQPTDERQQAVARIRKSASNAKGEMDWALVSAEVSKMGHPGPYDPAKPGFQGWDVKQLNELVWLLTEGDDDAPLGGEDQWR